eukprot:Hpha_TRINITY_DN11854_c1_g1::TRINITY_DN11854_c1_g1_i2::g.1888::m.1888/K08220/FLVCR, SLC49A1_2; MFS transporter, FLVCR family, feline leukemia virus subgroup C receptor-related protein
MVFYAVGPQIKGWKWAVLLAFAVNTASNSIMFMDFSSVGDVSKEVFRWVDEKGVPEDDSVTDGKLNWIYSASLLAVLPVAVPAARLLTTHQWPCIMAMSIFNCLGAWLRYLSVKHHNYGLAIFSSILIGFAAAVIITACAYVPSIWFSKSQRSFATSAAVMANYAGWALGTVLIPAMVKNTGPDGSGDSFVDGDSDTGIRDLQWFTFVQALIVSSCPIVTLLFHRERPFQDPDSFSSVGAVDSEDTVQEDKDASDIIPSHRTNATPSNVHMDGKLSWSSVECSCSISVPFVIQGMMHAVLGGISFTIPAVQTTLFSDLGFSDTEASWTNFAFVMSGVVTGLTAGHVTSKWTSLQETVITACYVAAAAALMVVSIVAYNQDDIGRDTAYHIYIVFMGIAGAGSLGFIGVALTHACRHLPGVPHSYSAGAIEWFVQVWGAVFSQICVAGKSSFVVLAIVTWVVTLISATTLRFHKATLQATEKLALSPMLDGAQVADR